MVAAFLLAAWLASVAVARRQVTKAHAPLPQHEDDQPGHATRQTASEVFEGLSEEEFQFVGKLYTDNNGNVDAIAGTTGLSASVLKASPAADATDFARRLQAGQYTIDKTEAAKQELRDKMRKHLTNGGVSKEVRVPAVQLQQESLPDGRTSSCLVAKMSGCYTIASKAECLSSKDGRSWADNGRCLWKDSGFSSGASCEVDHPSFPFADEADARADGHDCPWKDAPPRKDGDCFPADSFITTPSGIKLMQDLRVEDKVLTSDHDGYLFFDDVYFFGHADAARSAAYLRLELASPQHAEGLMQRPGAQLHISPEHFLPTCSSHQTQCEWHERIYVYARDIKIGSSVWYAEPDLGRLNEKPLTVNLMRVGEVTIVVKRGLYNPYTLSGDIVVNGVLASSHSSWCLDHWTPESLSGWLPGIYQTMFVPGRILYSVAGKRAADVLDMSNPQAQEYGHGPAFLVMCAVLALFLAIIVMYVTICARQKLPLGIFLGHRPCIRKIRTLQAV